MQTTQSWCSLSMLLGLQLGGLAVPGAAAAATASMLRGRSSEAMGSPRAAVGEPRGAGFAPMGSVSVSEAAVLEQWV